jgi:hypothetical protein
LAYWQFWQSAHDQRARAGTDVAVHGVSGISGIRGAAIGADGGLVESIVARSGSITTSGCPPVKFPFLKALPRGNRPKLW